MRIKKVSQTTSTQAQVVDGYSTSTSDSYSCNYVNGVAGKILWANPNPTSSFSSQTITLNSDDYDCYQVIYQMSTVNEKKNSTGIVPKGSGTMISFLMVEQGQFCVRGITYTNDTTFLTGDALNSNNSTANNRCIPLYVIGYKINLFN